MGRSVFVHLAYLITGLLSLGVGVFLATWILERSPAQPATNSGSQPAEMSIAEDVKKSEYVQMSPEELRVKIESFVEPFIYDPKGRRDPFLPYQERVAPQVEGFAGPLLPLQRFSLDDIELVGIIWDVGDPKAMFRDPNGQVHILGKDERIGRQNGYVATIREGEVVVVEATQQLDQIVYSTRVLRINR